jgi:hypothetical protein
MGITLPDDADVNQFYAATGKAMTRWQYVESGLFMVMHAVLGIDDAKFSGVIFFQAQSAGRKIELVDELCKTRLTGDVLSEWSAICTDVKAGLPFRNAMAHWEVNFIERTDYLAAGEPPIALARHHLDPKGDGDDRTITTNTAIEVADEYLTLAKRLFSFVATRFSTDKLRQTKLPPMLLEKLEGFARNPEPIRAPPPLSRQARRKLERENGDR